MLFCAISLHAAEREGPIVEFQGKIVPLSSSTNLQFRTRSGEVFDLIRNDRSEALFADTNLHSRILLLKGRVPPGTKKLEVTANLRSLKDDRVHELYYYCDVCAITTSFPGPCPCCREDVYLVEKAKE
jgi:hypothetical protein